MLEFLKTILIMVVGVGGFFAIFLGLYFAIHAVTKKSDGGVLAIPWIAFALVFAVGGLLIPTVRTVISSFKDDFGQEWVGFENYVKLFEENDTKLAILNSFSWMFIGTAVTVGIGLAIARYSDGMRGERFVKTLVFLPVAISLVGAGITWKFIYAERGFSFKAGLLNEVAGALHLPEWLGGGAEGRNWLLERGLGALTPPGWAPGFNSILLIIVFVWSQAGIATVVLSAAIKGVPAELQEAATVDGATSNEVFFKVTIPYIKGTIATVTALTALASLKAFDTVAAATGGNFGTTTVATEFYKKFYVQDLEGVASALAVLLFLLCLPIVIWNRRVQKRVEAES